LTYDLDLLTRSSLPNIWMIKCHLVQKS